MTADPPLIAVVVPTIAGRESLYAQAVASYRRNTPRVAVVTVRDRPTIGEAWDEGLAAALAIDGVEYVHLSADDVTVAARWWVDAARAADGGKYPAPRIETPDGDVFATGSLGGGMIPRALVGDRQWPVCSSQFPFLTVDQARRLAPVLHVHYYADDYLAHRARMAGLSPTYVPGYLLTHHEGTVGRSTVAARSRADFEVFMRAVQLSAALDGAGRCPDAATRDAVIDDGFEWGPGRLARVRDVVAMYGPDPRVLVVAEGSGCAAAAAYPADVRVASRRGTIVGPPTLDEPVGLHVVVFDRKPAAALADDFAAHLPALAEAGAVIVPHADAEKAAALERAATAAGRVVTYATDADGVLVGQVTTGNRAARRATKGGTR